MGPVLIDIRLVPRRANLKRFSTETEGIDRKSSVALSGKFRYKRGTTDLIAFQKGYSKVVTIVLNQSKITLS